MKNEIPNQEGICRLTQTEFLQLCEDLKKNNEDDLLLDCLKVRCAEDIETFSQVFFPHYCEYPFNRFHRDTFSDYKFGERNTRRAKAAPRGYAKSTTACFFKPIHDLCYKLESFIVIISNTEPQAIQKLKDIQQELIDNDFLHAVYGRFLKSKKVGSTDFIAYSGTHPVRFVALGAGTEMRGIRFGSVRPSKIILDDVEHSEKVESEMLRDKMLHWFQDVVSKIGDNKTNIDFIGTVLHRKSLLKSLLSNPRYFGREYKAIESWHVNKDLWALWQGIYNNIDNENRVEEAKAFFEANKDKMLEGTSVLWPEKEPYYDLQIEILESGLRSFMKEKQNDPLSDEEKTFNINDVWWYEERKEGLFILKTQKLIAWSELTPIGTIDPATGQSKASVNKKTDYTSIINGFHDLKGRVFVHEDWLQRASPSMFIRKIFEFMTKYQHSRFGVETNLYRELLLENIKDERERYERETGHRIETKFYDIYLTENKEKRIYTLEPKVKNGWILLNKKLSNTLLDQFWDFPKGEHDDGPDAVEMLWGLVNNKYKVSAVQGLNR